MSDALCVVDSQCRAIAMIMRYDRPGLMSDG